MSQERAIRESAIERERRGQQKEKLAYEAVGELIRWARECNIHGECSVILTFQAGGIVDVSLIRKEKRV